MVDKAHRFQGHGSLRFVYQKGNIVRGQYSSLKYICNNRRQTFRVAVVVSRKVHKSAVVRNRIRRRVFEIVRLQSERITQPYDLVFLIYNDQLSSLPATEVQAAIMYQLRKAAVLDTPA
jgi:ribonuclease P protein component